LANITVSALAEELKTDEKKITEFLKEKQIEISQDSLDDSQADAVRSAFAEQKKTASAGKKSKDAKTGAAKSAAKKPAASKEKDEKTGKKKAGEPVKKKKRIIQVFHPQNARSREVQNYGKTSGKKTVRGAKGSPEETKAAKRPLVKVPRPHPPASSYGPSPEEIAAEKKAARERAEKKAAEQEAAKAAAMAEEAAKKEAAEQEAARDASKKSEAEKARKTAEAPEGKPEKTQPSAKPQAALEKKPVRAEEARPARTASKESGARTSDRRSERPSRGESRSGEGRNFRQDHRRDSDRSSGGEDRRKRTFRGDRRAGTQQSQEPVSSRGQRGRGDREKDKNKSFLKENKYNNDRNGRNKHSRQNAQPLQMQHAKKKKEEKKVEKVTEIRLPERVVIRELAEKMKVQPSAIVKKLFMEGMMVTVNQEIDYDKAEEIAMDYDILVEPEEKVDVIAEMLKDDEEEDESKLVPRPPVVCVMGHVDHGKTSLLDAIRDSHVVDREAGGITQSIGAYVVEINGQKITFLDTPGHEAFTAMRMRGANSTDIAVLVVAADDGVMPQTVEAINHAKAAGVEIIVAINKIDKPNANVDRVKQELAEYNLVPEDWGGSTIFVPVSARTHEGIDNLLEMILLTAEVMELKANPDRKARALVLEAKLDKGKGPVVNVLVQKGTLHVGDYIACGGASGRVRAMTDENSHPVKAAGPSRPVEVQGLSDVPNAGEILIATDTDKEAKNFAATFINEKRSKLLEETRSRMSLDDLFSQIHEGDVKDLNIVVKADVQGSVEAVTQSLEKLASEEIAVHIVHGGVGAINESDVMLAAASNAIIIGFNVHPDLTAKTIAAQEKVDIRLYKVIYKAIEDVEAAMKGMLAPKVEEKVIGHAEVRQLFKASGVGTIAGSYVLDGTIQRGCQVRLYRDDEQIFEGNLASLKRFKDDVKEVKSGFECGLVFEDYNEIREGDKVEAYVMVEVPR
jgi:translation initiation factor IF-2